jgi:hypothetical protein
MADMAVSGNRTAMSEEFNRLRWSVFEDITKIQVANDPDGITPHLLPFLGHPIASEAASQDPLYEITFCIDALEEWEAPEYEENDIVIPEPLVVRRADGGIVTISDVIEQLSRYIITHKDIILEAKSSCLHWTTHETTEGGEHIDNIPAYEDVLASADTKVAFDGFFGSIEAGRYALPVVLWAEGEEGMTLEYYWKSLNDPDQFLM